MSSNTKQVLAITLGCLGLVIGIFGTITAYNAKKAIKDDQDVTTQVQQQFAVAQAAQDAKDASQASDAEKLIASLSTSEKSLIKKINGNTKGVKKLKKQNRKLKQQLNALSSRDAQLDTELTKAENDIGKANNRINKTNQQVSRNTTSIQRLNNRLNINEPAALP